MDRPSAQGRDVCRDLRVFTLSHCQPSLHAKSRVTVDGNPKQMFLFLYAGATGAIFYELSRVGKNLFSPCGGWEGRGGVWRG